MSQDSAAPAPSALVDLISLTKPRLSSLVLVTAGGGIWLSQREVSLTVALVTIVGTILVVGGANALNNYLERDSDREMARTANRPLPARRMSPQVALAFGAALGGISVPLLAWMTTPLAALLAALGFVSYVMIYTPLKRRSSLSTLIGAFPGALPPLIGWTAVTGRLEAGGLALFALLFLWQIPHSLAIGIYRQSEYEKAGLVVFPSEHGLVATRRQMFLYTLALVPIPLVLVHLGVAGLITLFGGAALGLIFVWMVGRGLGSGDVRWARKVFIYSLVYLTALFGALAADQWLRA
jgi:heme o synthase